MGEALRISKKFGVNPSVTRCICYGKSYGVALFGTAWKDKNGKTAETPREVFQGLCDDCQGVIDQGGVMIIEVKDGEHSDNPYRTGRLVGVSKEFKERNNIEDSIVYMTESVFNKVFGEVEFKNNKED